MSLSYQSPQKIKQQKLGAKTNMPFIDGKARARRSRPVLRVLEPEKEQKPGFLNKSSFS